MISPLQRYHIFNWVSKTHKDMIMAKKVPKGAPFFLSTTVYSCGQKKRRTFWNFFWNDHNFVIFGDSVENVVSLEKWDHRLFRGMFCFLIYSFFVEILMCLWKSYFIFPKRLLQKLIFLPERTFQILLVMFVIRSFVMIYDFFMLKISQINRIST